MRIKITCLGVVYWSFIIRIELLGLDLLQDCSERLFCFERFDKLKFSLLVFNDRVGVALKKRWLETKLAFAVSNVGLVRNEKTFE
jgi:hypothetical protein